MFALFFSLYYAMFTGTWNNVSWNDIFNPSYVLGDKIKKTLNVIGSFITSIFGDNVYDDLGTIMNGGNIILVVCLILSLITSIGIVIMAVKGIKRVFGIFFMPIR